MKNFIYYLLLLVLIIMVTALITRKRIRPESTDKKFRGEKKSYNYAPRDSVMTNAERNFFLKLVEAVNGRYYIFPQMHLSALLNHKIKGQDWKPAFSHINGKSVDYVLCDKNTLQPVYAIELDDYTHYRDDRRTRDDEVERIFREAGLPLIRFDGNVSPEKIVYTLSESRGTLH